MSKVVIVTDSNSGITPDEAKQLGIRVIPMPFSINGEEYFEEINLNQAQFYDFMNSGANVSTSQPAIGFVMSLWDELLTEFDEVVYIPMSSGLSESCRVASNMAEEEYKDKVFVVDNHRISVTLYQSVLDAKYLADKGLSGKEIHDELIKTAYNADIYIMLDTLKYLKKGGRITPAAAAVGEILKIKPVLTIKGEKLDKFKMLNRTTENGKRVMIEALHESFEEMKNLDGRTDNIELYSVYSGTDYSAALEFKKQIEEEFPGVNVKVDKLSLSISCHIGPKSLALAMTKKISE